MKKTFLGTLIAASLLASSSTMAADYVIDTQGAHASIQFKVSHLGYSFVVGRFNDFAGKFSFDAAKPRDARVNVTINTNSLDSNHAERDKHLRSADFLNAAKYPQASFVSTGIEDKGEGKLAIVGELTLNGVTKAVTLEAMRLGEGQDPWGGYRAGFVASTEFALKDFNIAYDLGPASSRVGLDLVVEGIRQ
jgi:polyisoprenoid-binding protein YceI